MCLGESVIVACAWIRGTVPIGSGAARFSTLNRDKGSNTVSLYAYRELDFFEVYIKIALIIFLEDFTYTVKNLI